MTTGLRALVEALRHAAIDTVFGVPGTQSVPLFEEFRQAGIRTILATDELAAAFMANGYFRASGRIAALATIAGPGFTYALTGLAEARHDSVGILHLVATSRSHSTRAFRLQAIDQRTIAGPLVKKYVVLDGTSDVAASVGEAVDLARHGEPGPVIVELDCNELSETHAFTAAASGDDRNESVVPERLAERFAAARRPVFLLGSGSTGASQSLASLASSLRIPIVTTPSGRGVIGEDNVLVMGYDPLRGNTDDVNRLFAESDLILGLGCKLTHNGTAGYRLRLAPEKFVHVDADRVVLGANYEADLTICARIEQIVPHLMRRTRKTEWEPSRLSELRNAIRTVMPEAETRIHGPAGSLQPAQFFSWLRACLADDTIVVTDSGLHQILARKYYEVRVPQGLLFPSDFQSMGFGLPAAIGACVAAPDRDVIAIVGDGGFLMSGLELMTAQREELPLVVIVFNDGQLNQIRLQQLGDSGRSHAVRLANPDYETLATAFGISYGGFNVSALSETEKHIRATRRPLLIEVPVGDSLDLHVRTGVALTKTVARKVMGPGLRAWIKARLA